MAREEVTNAFENARVDLFLQFLFLQNVQRVIATLDYEQLVRRSHLASHLLEQIERTQGVARALHKEDRCRDLAQDFVAQLCRIAAAAKRVPQTDERVHIFLEREMAADSAAHALPDQDNGAVMRATR